MLDSEMGFGVIGCSILDLELHITRPDMWEGSILMIIIGNIGNYIRCVHLFLFLFWGRLLKTNSK